MYNRPRRGGYGSPASNVGRRRPQPTTNNFVPGGQLVTKPEPIQSPYKRKQETPEQKPPIVTPPVQTPTPKPEPVPVEVNLQKTAEAILNKQNKVEPAAQAAAPTVEAPKAETTTDAAKEEENNQMDVSQEEGTPAKQPKMWHKRTKVPKAEKQRQSNIRLRKILQPRAAPMLLPEIFGKLKYNVEPANKEQQQFKAVVNVHGLAHEGVGATSKEAETAAAEAALKHIALAKLKAEKAALRKAATGETDPTVEKMEQDDDEAQIVNQEPEYNKSFSFEHLASFAMYKLLSSWDNEGKPADGSYLNLMSNTNFDAGLSDNKKTPEFRASKKMPANPELMNPVMLLNQMHPEAVYEMICVTGSAHKVISFTMKCTLGNKAFVGHGSSKKAAKKKAAYEACKDVLGIVYPEENSEVNETTNSVLELEEAKPPAVEEN